MSKSALALTSLVMAIPAGLAFYVCVKSILDYSENMPSILTGIMWVLAILLLILALFPFWVLIFMRKGSAPVAAAAPVAEPTAPVKKPAKAASDDDEFGGDDGEDSEQLFDEEEAVADDDFDDNFDFDEEPEEEAPKKKKKK